ncbi:hypothetical protein P7H75_05675 [Vagococcus carniphilus]|uniref:hypothetical protein n=1 Tax=Vagococcus carniphilus TaxID=218144 RepID=UPI0028903262|nr:hypothetical protein [Vagococcus carniphilus]MDT2814328.1 hypothetical protein [Vagococcus carniphilus]
MTDIKLTKESEYVLTAMYKEFLDRYNQGVPRDKCKTFGHQVNILKLVPEIPEQDIYGLLSELARCEVINVSPGANIFMLVSINTNGIIYMENKLGKDVSKIVNWLLKTKSLFI